MLTYMDYTVSVDGLPDDNPNEYDDDAFTAASGEGQAELTHVFEALWKSGASKKDIEDEIANAFANGDFS
jgi:hypothetical protein